MVLEALQAGKQTYTKKKLATLIRTFFNFFWAEWGGGGVGGSVFRVVCHRVDWDAVSGTNTFCGYSAFVFICCTCRYFWQKLWTTDVATTVRWHLLLTLQSPVASVCTTCCNITQLWILPTYCIYVFHTILMINANYVSYTASSQTHPLVLDPEDDGSARLWNVFNHLSC